MIMTWISQCSYSTTLRILKSLYQEAQTTKYHVVFLTHRHTHHERSQWLRNHSPYRLAFWHRSKDLRAALCGHVQVCRSSQRSRNPDATQLTAAQLMCSENHHARVRTRRCFKRSSEQDSRWKVANSCFAIRTERSENFKLSVTQTDQVVPDASVSCSINLKDMCVNIVTNERNTTTSPSTTYVDSSANLRFNSLCHAAHAQKPRTAFLSIHQADLSLALPFRAVVAGVEVVVNAPRSQRSPRLVSRNWPRRIFGKSHSSTCSWSKRSPTYRHGFIHKVWFQHHVGHCWTLHRCRYCFSAAGYRVTGHFSLLEVHHTKLTPTRVLRITGGHCCVHSGRHWSQRAPARWIPVWNDICHGTHCWFILDTACGDR